MAADSRGGDNPLTIPSSSRQRNATVSPNNNDRGESYSMTPLEAVPQEPVDTLVAALGTSIVDAVNAALPKGLSTYPSLHEAEDAIGGLPKRQYRLMNKGLTRDAQRLITGIRKKSSKGRWSARLNADNSILILWPT